MEANVRLCGIHAGHAREEGSPLIKQAVELYRAGYDFSRSRNKHKQHEWERLVHTYIDEASIGPEMRKLSEDEVVLWNKRLPQVVMGLDQYIQNLLYDNLSILDHLPWSVLHHLNYARNRVAFHGFKFRYSLDEPHVMLTALRLIKEKDTYRTEEYVLALWNAGGGKVLSLEDTQK